MVSVLLHVFIFTFIIILCNALAKGNKRCSKDPMRVQIPKYVVARKDHPKLEDKFLNLPFINVKHTPYIVDRNLAA